MTDTRAPKSHLDWIELDFSAGMWTVGDWLVPPNGAQLLEDCYPQPGLGLRAAHKFEQWPLTGIPATQTPIGFYVQSGIAERGGGTDASIYYLVTYSSADNRVRVWQWDLTQTVDPTTWTEIHAFTALGSVPAVFFTEYTITTGVTGTHVYMSLRGAGGTDDGLWRIRYITGAAPANSTVTQIEAIVNPGPITTHQDRIVVSKEDGGSIVWNDTPGAETITEASSVLMVQPYLPETITAFLKSWVSDLLVGKFGAPFTLVSGDLTDPYVRTLLNAHHPGGQQVAAEMDEGIVYQSYRDGIYVTKDGASATKLSPQLAPDTIAPTLVGVSGNMGALMAIGEFLFTPSGHVYDRRTKAWHRRSDMYGEFAEGRWFKHMAYDRSPDFQQAWFVSEGIPSKILYGRPFEAATASARLERMKAVSPPLRHPSGRHIRVRKVQPYFRVYADGGLIRVTVNGTTHEKVGLGQGKQQLVLPFLEAAEVLDITVETDSGNSGVEAPSIEAIRVGVQPGHLPIPTHEQP